MKENNSLYNKLIKPIRDPAINETIKSLSIELLSPYDKNFSFAERFIPINILHRNFFKWISKSIIGLELLENQYVTNGNTNFIDQIILTKKPQRIVTLKNDYSYYGHIAKALDIEKFEIDINQLTELNQQDLVFLSVPFAANGQHLFAQDLIQYCYENKIQLALDIAYAGTATEFKIHIPKCSNICLGFTFSKTFGIPYNRIGVCYSDSKIAGFETMSSIGYVNLAGVNLINTLIKKYPVDYLYKKYYNNYLQICKKLELDATECILFAYNKIGDRICVTDYLIDQQQDNALS